MIELAAREHARLAKRPVVLTGAGVSAASGVPTFRGEEGLWRDHRPEELATPEAFRRDPALVWEWYRWRRELVAQCAPNPAHEALAAYESEHPAIVLVTQNVDGLHRRAGSRRIVELHGNLFTDLCSGCRREREAEPRGADETAELPRCECGALIRPGVVWFGEPVPKIEEAFAAAAEADLVLVVGTSGVVEPAASVARVAGSRGAFVIEINPDATPLSDLADVCLRGSAAELLPELIEKSAGG